jgi:hypothetical protein
MTTTIIISVVAAAISGLIFYVQHKRHRAEMFAARQTAERTWISKTKTIGELTDKLAEEKRLSGAEIAKLMDENIKLRSVLHKYNIGLPN